MTNQKATGECEACPKVGTLAKINNMMLCESCFSKELLAGHKPDEITPEIELPPSDSPLDLKKAYIDEYNDVVVSGATHEQIRQKIADMQDYVKLLQVKIQARMDADDDWMERLSDEARAAQVAKDRAHPIKARPAMNADGTRQVKAKADPKPIVVGDVGDKAFENLVEKLIRTGMDRPTAENMIRGMKK